MSESLGVLGNDPVAGLDIHDLKPREKLAHEGEHLVRDVLAARAAHEQRRLLEAGRGRVLVREVAHVREGLAQDVERDAELLGRGPFWGVEVAEEELPDGEGLG